MIYFNNADITLQKPETVRMGKTASLDDAKELTARLFAVKNPECIHFVRGEDQAMELALRTLIQPDDHVIATPMEQDTTCTVLDRLKDNGTKVSFAEVNSYGSLDMDSLEALIQPSTKAIICAHGCGVTGNVIDLEQVCAMARRHGLLVISDGNQTVGAMEINLEELGVDVYCFCAHRKLMGPHDFGVFYVKEEVWKQIFQSASRDSELTPGLDVLSPEESGAYCAALEFVLEKGIYGISVYPHRLAKRFFEAVKSMNDVTVYGDFGNSRRIPIISVAVKGFTPQQIKKRLVSDYGIVVKSGLCGGAKMHQALGTEKEGLVRFSFGYFNTRKEVGQTVLALMELTENIDYYLL